MSEKIPIASNLYDALEKNGVNMYAFEKQAIIKIKQKIIPNREQRRRLKFKKESI